MKQTALFITCLLLATTLYAGKEFCPPDAVHCAYISGLSDDANDGRYIKLSNARTSLVVCLNSYSTVFFDEISAKKYVGNNADQYSICADAKGSRCEVIGSDHFVVNKNDQDYTAEPRYFDINLANIKSDFPSCHLAGKNTIQY